VNALSMPQLSRRWMLATSGALIVSFALSKRTPADEPPAAAAPPEALPGSLAHTPMLDAWIKVDATGRATVFTGKVELGQGLKTAVIQLAAEQLALAPEQNRGTYYWASIDIRTKPVESSEAGILNAVRERPLLVGAVQN